MLYIQNLDSWLDFENIIEKRLLEETQQVTAGPFLYRGHSDADWHLDTTLERSAGPNLSVSAYYRIIERIQPEIETFADRKWDLPNYKDYLSTLAKRPTYGDNRVQTYMGYLRHFGFPSPLLDWTKSPFVAAYFAFRDVSSKAKSVAIYEFLAHSEFTILGVEDIAQIFPVFTSTQKNKRHYLQQSVYTVCLRKTDDDIYYSNHEDQLMAGIGFGGIIRKYILPASERITALNSLEAYNINAYSLIGTEESLLETLFLKIYKMSMISKTVSGSDNNEF
jgi:hypothetical protein